MMVGHPAPASRSPLLSPPEILLFTDAQMEGGELIFRTLLPRALGPRSKKASISTFWRCMLVFWPYTLSKRG